MLKYFTYCFFLRYFTVRYDTHFRRHKKNAIIFYQKLQEKESHKNHNGYFDEEMWILSHMVLYRNEKEKHLSPHFQYRTRILRIITRKPLTFGPKSFRFVSLYCSSLSAPSHAITVKSNINKTITLKSSLFIYIIFSLTIIIIIITQL